MPESHPAHALLSVAHALLCPANTVAAPTPAALADKEPIDLTVLPIDEVSMPTEDVSDLRDVVDAINRLCETMKTSGYEETKYEDCMDATWQEEMAVENGDVVTAEELVSPEEVAVREVETFVAERWSDEATQQAVESEAAASDTDHAAVCCEPLSEMYYTASSEVSLLSAADAELPEDRRAMEAGHVMAGHVAAMRERFESMTRANTPCPDLARSLSPSLDLFRNVTPSPDRLDD